jgi:hypothetical protein
LRLVLFATFDFPQNPGDAYGIGRA